MLSNILWKHWSESDGCDYEDAEDADNNIKSQHSSNMKAKQSLFLGSEPLLIMLEATFQQRLLDFVSDV